MASLAQRRTAEPNRVCVLIRVFLRELNVIVDRIQTRPFRNEDPVLLSLRRSNEYRVYETNSLYSKKRTCYVPRIAKITEKSKSPAGLTAGLVRANLWTGFSEFLKTPLDYKVNNLGVARSGTDHCRSGWVAAIVRSGKKTRRVASLLTV